MSIDFQAALVYPFREENRRDMVWRPGIFIYVTGIFFFLLIAIIGFGLLGAEFWRALADASAEPEGTAALVDIGSNLIQCFFQLFVSIFVLGYLWQMCGRWQREGYQTPAIDWLEQPWQIFKDGCKLMIYYMAASLIMFLPLFGVLIFAIVILGLNAALFTENTGWTILVSFIVTILALLVVVLYTLFIGPFLYGPVIASAQTRRFSDLFNLMRGWKLALRNYQQGLWAMLAIVGLSLIYLVGMVLLLLPCCIGLVIFPFLSLSHYVSMAYLANQGLWNNEPPMITAPEAPQIISG